MVFLSLWQGQMIYVRESYFITLTTCFLPGPCNRGLRCNDYLSIDVDTMGGFFSKIFGKVSNEGKILLLLLGSARFNFKVTSSWWILTLIFWIIEAAKILNTFRERYTELLKTRPDARSSEVILIESFQYNTPILFNIKFDMDH